MGSQPTKLKILVLSDFFPPFRFGGAENIAYEISKELSNLGHQLTIFTTESKENNGKLRNVVYNSLSLKIADISPNIRYSGYSGLVNFKALKALDEILKKQDFDVAMIHNIHHCISYYAISILDKYSINSIMTAHDAVPFTIGKYSFGISFNNIESNIIFNASQSKIWKENWKRYNPFRLWFLKNQFRKIRKIICVSYELEKLYHGNNITNTCVIHNGLPEANKTNNESLEKFKRKYGITDKDFLIIFAGRISNLKGFELSLKLLKHIRLFNKNFKLLIAGEAKTAINRNSVISTGWLNKDEMNLAYKCGFITIVPSIYLDPFPTVAIESLRAGTPVIISKYSGAKEAIEDKKNGFIVNPLNVSKISDEILSLANDPNKYEEFSKHARERFDEYFLINKCVDNYMNILI